MVLMGQDWVQGEECDRYYTDKKPLLIDLGNCEFVGVERGALNNFLAKLQVAQSNRFEALGKRNETKRW